jgi:hypothetical protein
MKSIPISTNGKREGENKQLGGTLAESQFYARTSNTPISKRQNFTDRKADEIYSSPLIDETFHDALDNGKKLIFFI